MLSVSKRLRQSDQPSLWLLLFLLLVSVPAFAQIRWPILFFTGIEIEPAGCQIYLVTSFILITAFAQRIPRTRLFMQLSGVFLALFVYNVSLAIFGASFQVVPRLRGVYTFGINLIAFVIALRLLNGMLTPRCFARTVALYGAIVALSAVAEFVILHTSDALLWQWREMIWGNAVGDGDLMTIGGVTLSTSGVSRVGGIIGAPENLGYALAFTLPFVIVAELPTGPHAILSCLYMIAAVVTGSRTLGILMGIYMILTFFRGDRMSKRQKLAFLIIIVVSLSIIIKQRLNEQSLKRYSWEAIVFEHQWRLGALKELVERVRGSEATELLGIGLGYGADQNAGIEWSVTSGVWGGDVSVAYVLGGIFGLAILGVLWWSLFGMRSRVKSQARSRLAAVDTFLFVCAADAFLRPELMLWFLTSGIVVFLAMFFLAWMEFTIWRGSVSDVTGTPDSGKPFWRMSHGASPLLSEKTYGQ